MARASPATVGSAPTWTSMPARASISATDRLGSWPNTASGAGSDDTRRTLRRRARPRSMSASSYIGSAQDTPVGTTSATDRALACVRSATRSTDRRDRLRAVEGEGGRMERPRLRSDGEDESVVRQLTAPLELEHSVVRRAPPARGRARSARPARGRSSAYGSEGDGGPPNGSATACGRRTKCRSGVTSVRRRQPSPSVRRPSSASIPATPPPATTTRHGSTRVTTSTPRAPARDEARPP